jgi:XTP/dITP diphosphohydrolase
MNINHSRLHFVSQNPFKAEEVTGLGYDAGIEILHVREKIEELQTNDDELLIRDKTLKAFAKIRFPVVVDHSGLHLECLGGMPGALTQVFWDNLGAKLCDIARAFGNKKASASCFLGYCDGYMIHVFSARLEGKISDAPLGSRAFQWDTIFIPEGTTQTYGEMTAEMKNKFSQRRRAFDNLLLHLQK